MKRLMMITLFLMVGCSNPIEVIEVTEVIEIIEIVEADQYWISPLGRVFPVTAKWQRGLPILRGLIRNVSEDTLFNKKMRFIISERGNPDNLLSDTFGFFTLEKTKSEYFPIFPYKIELDLVPNVIYNIYVAGDTIDLNIANSWWYELVPNE